MASDMEQEKITVFKGEPVTFIETQRVKDGVTCDVYTYDNDKRKDLGIISASPGAETPLQRMQKGDKTIEGFVDGVGTFTVTRQEGGTEEYHFPGETKEVKVAVGDVMQWKASRTNELIFYEVCYPPYEDDRFENLS